MNLRKSLEDRVSDYTTKDYVTVSMSDSVTSAARAMQQAGSGEAIVVQKGTPIGIVTEKDILYKVVAAGKDPSKLQAQDVMTSPVEGIEEDENVKDAISKMSRLGVRRLTVLRGGKMVGLVVQKRIVTGSANVHVDLPELTTPNGVTCPYCDAQLKDASELSRHVDRLHVGGGLLEGNMRKW